MSTSLPSGGAEPPPDKRDPYAAFRIPEYRYYVLGWFAATLGTRIQSVAIGWEMYQRTGEPLSLGLVGLAQALPTMLLALPAGLLADNYNRRSLMMLSLLGMTVTSFGLAILSYNQGSIALMYVLLFLDAAAVMVGRPARVALLPLLVPVRALSNAITWNSSLMQMSGMVGPALGGLIIIVSVPAAYVVAALSSLIFMVMLAFLEFEGSPQRAGQMSWDNLVAGVRFVWRAKIILTMISLDLFAVLLGGAVYLLPIYATEILGVGAGGFGILRAAPAIGAFCMAIMLVYLPPMKHAGRMLLWNVAGFGIATIIFGLSTSFWLSFAMLFLTGAFDNVSMVVRGTLQQLLTPDYMRGRVAAVSAVFIGASNELGGFESGLVAQWLGPVISVVSGGIGTLMVVGATAWLSPDLRKLGRMEDSEPLEEIAQSTLAASAD